jgi:ANTAR domain
MRRRAFRFRAERCKEERSRGGVWAERSLRKLFAARGRARRVQRPLFVLRLFPVKGPARSCGTGPSARSRRTTCLSNCYGRHNAPLEGVSWTTSALVPLRRSSRAQGFAPKRIPRNGAKGSAVAESSDRADETIVATDGNPAAAQAAADIARLTLYADEQARKVEALEETIGQLQNALDSRVVTERAVGMLAERFDLTTSDAFELLRSAARNSRRGVRELAEELTESRGWTPDEIVDARRRLEPS